MWLQSHMTVNAMGNTDICFDSTNADKHTQHFTAVKGPTTISIIVDTTEICIKGSTFISVETIFYVAKWKPSDCLWFCSNRFYGKIHFVLNIAPDFLDWVYIGVWQSKWGKMNSDVLWCRYSLAACLCWATVQSCRKTARCLVSNDQVLKYFINPVWFDEFFTL